MPTYEYVCTSCKNHFDAFQRFSEPALETCERCGGELRRVFHPASIQFKGSGFYSTDSGRRSTFVPKAKSEKAGDTSSSGSDKGSGSGSDKGSGSGSGSGSDKGSRSSGGSGSTGSPGSDKGSGSGSGSGSESKASKTSKAAAEKSA